MCDKPSSPEHAASPVSTGPLVAQEDLICLDPSNEQTPPHNVTTSEPSLSPGTEMDLLTLDKSTLSSGNGWAAVQCEAKIIDGDEFDAVIWDEEYGLPVMTMKKTAVKHGVTANTELVVWGDEYGFTTAA